MMSLYSFTFKDINQQDVSGSIYQGKVCLVFNSATGCGFTPQYEAIQRLYETYQDQGFEVLDFPCNQFLNQAPGTDKQLASFCQLVYHTTFTTYAKININGPDAHPFYKYLKQHAPKEKANIIKSIKQKLTKNAIEWNFVKFLIDRNGHVVKRYNPTVPFEIIEQDIQALL